MIATTARPVETEDGKLARGILAIRQAFTDVSDGTLTCPCTECELRRMTESESV